MDIKFECILKRLNFNSMFLFLSSFVNFMRLKPVEKSVRCFQNLPKKKLPKKNYFLMMTHIFISHNLVIKSVLAISTFSSLIFGLFKSSLWYCVRCYPVLRFSDFHILFSSHFWIIFELLYSHVALPCLDLDSTAPAAGGGLAWDWARADIVSKETAAWGGGTGQSSLQLAVRLAARGEE